MSTKTHSMLSRIISSLVLGRKHPDSEMGFIVLVAVVPCIRTNDTEASIAIADESSIRIRQIVFCF